MLPSLDLLAKNDYENIETEKLFKIVHVCIERYSINYVCFLYHYKNLIFFF